MAPTTKLQLCLTASNLPRTAKLSAQHVRAQVCVVPPNYATGEQPTHLGTTEVIKSSHPRWTKIFHLEYEFGSQLTFYVDILIGSGESSVPKSIGIANFEVGDVLGSRNKTKVKRLRKGGCVFAHIEPCSEEGAGGRVVFQLSALRLEWKQRMLSRSEPSTFFEIARQTPTSIGNKWVVVYRSQPVLESLRPCWDKAEVDLETFCNRDTERPILVSVYIHKKKGNHALLGSFESTVKILLEKAEAGSERDWHQSTFALQTPGYKAYESVGTIAVMEGSIIFDGESATTTNGDRISPRPLPIDTSSRCESTSSAYSNYGNVIDSPGSFTSVTVDMASLQLSQSRTTSSSGNGHDSTSTSPRYTFSDYVESGLDVALSVAIDFTSSNGDPRIPGTLHYNSDGSLNDYEETIMSVGKAIAKYSKDEDIPVWGFGAKYGGLVRHLFQCGSEATATDVDGVLDDYRSVFLTDLTMSGPTVILDVIKAAASRAKRYDVRSLKYGVLLILTDGIVSDAEATKSLLHAVSDLPLSVLIVGIGAADFRLMQEIVEYSNQTSRPNVSFVAYRPHQHDPRSLSRAALKDIPAQVVDYLKRKGVPPRRYSGLSETSNCS
mmetsp:Transcript_13135/g.28512  ORF Transcript_13135/g.28512 Transcript_13135/m.28512 type:complete len:607 (+) Transcript_13135:148-1968(+)